MRNARFLALIYVRSLGPAVAAAPGANLPPSSHLLQLCSLRGREYEDAALSTIRKLMEWRADNSAIRDYDLRTPLHIAARDGQVEPAQLLLAFHADPNVNVDSRKRTAMHLAAEAGHVPVARMLLRNYADPDIADDAGATSLHIAARRGNAELVTLLLSGRATPSAANGAGHTPLHSVLGRGAFAADDGGDAIVRALAAANADMRRLDNTGCTPLCLGASRGSRIAIETLLDLGSDPAGPRDNSRRAPLHWAAARGHTSVAEVLLAHRASVKVKDNEGKTPLQWAQASGHESVAAAISYAVRNRSSARRSSSDNQASFDITMGHAPREPIFVPRPRDGG